MRTIKVLIVEGEMIVAKDIAYYLEELGCEVCGLVYLRQIDRIEENRITIGSKNITVSRSYSKDFLDKVNII